MPTPFKEDLTFVHGCMMLSTWISSCLYTVELLLAGHYFVKHKNENRRYNWIVVGMLVADSVSTAALLANTYISVIYTTGSLTTRFGWPVPMLLCAKSVAGLLEHGFLIYRFWYLSNNTTVSVFLSMLSVATSVFLLIAGVTVAIRPELSSPRISVLSQTIAMSLNLATDILIPVSLVWELLKIHTVYRSTKSLIRRICISSLSTGLVVAVVNAIGLILYLLSTSVYIVFLDTLNRLYTLTVLFNLSFGLGSRSSQHTSDFIHTPGGMNNNILLTSIHIRQSTQTRADGPGNMSTGSNIKNSDSNTPSSVQERRHDSKVAVAI